MLNQELLKDFIQYNSNTGIFTYIKSINPRVKVGAIAGYDKGAGYLYIKYKKKRYFLHRLAFLYMTGEIPNIVDHVNGLTNDNRWCNLRSCDIYQSNSNRRLAKHNTSGIKGITWHKKNQRWIARLGVEYNRKLIGCFLNIEDAKIALEKERLISHKEFTNHG